MMRKDCLQSKFLLFCLVFTLGAVWPANALQAPEGLKLEMFRLAQLANDNLTDDPELVLLYSSQLAELARQEKDSIYWAYALNLKGQIYTRQLKTSVALRVFQQAYKLKKNDPNIVLNLANAYRLAGDFKESLYYYNLANELSSFQKRTRIMSQLSQLYFDNQDYAMAYQYVQGVQKFAVNCKDSLVASLYMGQYALATDSLDQASEYLNTAQQQLNVCGMAMSDYYLQALFHKLMGVYMLRSGDEFWAAFHLSEAIGLSEKHYFADILLEVYRSMQQLAFLDQNMQMLDYYTQKERLYLQASAREVASYYESLVEDQSQQNKAHASRQLFYLRVLMFTVGLLLLLIFVGLLYFFRHRFVKFPVKLNRQAVSEYELEIRN
jgi:hypothetical protein